jgi:dihydrofolate reductase
MKAIVAMDLNRVIGNNGKLPWKSNWGDLSFFRQMTDNPKTGGFLLMGRKTFDSVGLLPNRFTYVLTNDLDKRKTWGLQHCRYLNSEEFEQVMEPSDKIWVCGGADVYAKYIPLCTEVYVTIILEEYEGDTYLEPFEDDFPKQQLIMEKKRYWIIKYSK